ncbi:MAG TPA: peptide chain release factor 2 [Candidatus Saccharimonadales bacterium]|nr:peptide chain release factor 2 [Candidatus Saccharimonadales bacterium]
MDELLTKAKALQSDIRDAAERLKLFAHEKELDKLQAQSQQPDFWQDNLAAQAVMKQIAKLEARTKPWRELLGAADELIDIIHLKVEGSEQEVTQQLDFITKKFDEYKEQLKLNGPYDDHDAILSIHAGAGGTDAQDWAQMLFRMYQRYAEKAGWQTQLIDESPGEEAGLKSVTLELAGPFAYGKLKGEHGVHRLVRLSPFNAESRETSFAKVEVTPKIDAPDELEIDDKDLKVDVYRSGGHGGQSVNTTDSAVRVTHLPTGIVVAIQNERSQLQNKELALTILRSKLAQLQQEQHAEKVSELKGPNEEAAWGNQIRNYVLHPYKQVKDLRTSYTSTDPDQVLDGNLDPFIEAYLEANIAAN